MSEQCTLPLSVPSPSFIFQQFEAERAVLRHSAAARGSANHTRAATHQQTPRPAQVDSFHLIANLR